MHLVEKENSQPQYSTFQYFLQKKKKKKTSNGNTSKKVLSCYVYLLLSQLRVGDQSCPPTLDGS